MPDQNLNKNTSIQKLNNMSTIDNIRLRLADEYDDEDGKLNRSTTPVMSKAYL